MAFTFNKCFDSNNNEFAGLYEILPKVFGDDRGYFLETYSEKDFFDAGLTMHFVQDNQSKSIKGVLRGMHFQTKHPQGKLVRALQGKVYDVAVDLRNNSLTFGKYYATILDSNLQNMFYIPQGFAHGFYVLTDEATFAYKCTDFYDPSGEAGIMWDDPNININWSIVAPNIIPLLSEKDKKHRAFDISKKYFSLSGKWEGQ